MIFGMEFSTTQPSPHTGVDLGFMGISSYKPFGETSVSFSIIISCLAPTGRPL
jgi:hypothetical protein